MGIGSFWHILIVGIVVVIFFGRGKVSALMGDLGKGISDFKKGMASEAANAPTTTAAPVATTQLAEIRAIAHQPADAVGSRSAV